MVGTITLQSVIRGSVPSCSVGYRLDEGAQGRGLATAALREATHAVNHELRLHLHLHLHLYLGTGAGRPSST